MASPTPSMPTLGKIYAIKNVGTSTRVDMRFAVHDEGNPIVGWHANLDSNNQLWELRVLGTTKIITLRSIVTRTYATAINQTKDTKVVGSVTADQFMLNELEAGKYRIQALDKFLSWNLAAAGDNQQILLEPSNRTDNQLWTFEEVTPRP